MTIDKYLNNIFEYNVLTLEKTVQKGESLDAIQTHPFFHKVFKTIHKWIDHSHISLVSHNHRSECFGDVFFNAYELIYYKHFNLSLEDYLIKINRKFKTPPGNDVLDWMLSFWFTIAVLQWWWYQLTHNIDYEEPFTYATIEQVSLEACRCAVNNLFITLNLSEDFPPDHPLMVLTNDLKKDFANLRSVHEFHHIWNKVAPLKIHNNGIIDLLQDKNKEDVFYRMTLYFYVSKFKDIMNLLISNESDLPQ